SVRARIIDSDARSRSLVAAVHSGTGIAALTDQLSKRSAERAGLEAEMDCSSSPRAGRSLDSRRRSADVAPVPRDPFPGTRPAGTVGAMLAIWRTLSLVRAAAVWTPPAIADRCDARGAADERAGLMAEVEQVGRRQVAPNGRPDRWCQSGKITPGLSICPGSR